MPDIELSPALTSNMLVDDFSVKRRIETIDEHGRMSVATTIIPTFGVVVPATPDDLDTSPDMRYARKTLSITTEFRLRGPASGYQPDWVSWRGDDYQVTNVGDYSAFGDGFIIATAQSRDAQDQPPQE